MSTYINTSVWQQPITLYTDMNVRTGAADLDDPDFENYPPFVKNDLAQGHQYTNLEVDCLYSALLSGAELPALNQPIDTSIAYCACKNMEVPINNIFGYCTSPMSTSGYPSVTGNADMQIIESKKEPLPLMFMHTRAYQRARAIASTMYNPSASYANPFYTSSAGRYNCNRIFMQGGLNADVNGTQGSNDDATGIKASNANLFCAYYRDFGIRSVYGVIFVKYYTGVSSTNMPTGVNDTPLDTYAANTAEWRAARPLCCAYMRMYYRSNIDGSYQTAGWGNGFKPDLTLNLVSLWDFNNEVHVGDKMQQPVANYIYNQNNNTCPLFGVIGADMYSNRGMGPKGNNAISENVVLLIGGSGEDGISQCQGTGSNAQYLWCTMEGTDENLENIRKWAACYGLFFTGNNTLYTSAYEGTRWTHPDMMLGVVDDEGYTDGTYTRGSENPTANNFDWKTASESRYDPIKPPPSPENTYSTATTFNSIGDLATMSKRYVLTASAVEQLGTALWDISAALSDNGTDFSELTEKSLDMFLTNNPIDAIISLQRYPLEIPAVGTTTVKLGKTDTGISAKPMEKTAYFYLFYGSKINPKFGDSFLDYQPYTKMELYIPFCGTIQMNPADIIGRTLNVQLVVDFTTGTATGFIMSDDLVIETVNGNIAIDIPVTGIQSATVASQLNNAIANKSNKTLEAQSASLGNISAGGVIRALKDPIKMIYGYQEARNEEQRAEYDLTHQNAPIHIIGSASAVGGWAIDLQCRLIIYYPSGDVIRTGQPPEWNNTQLAIYGRTTGFACCIEGALSSTGTGLVVGINPDLNGMVTGVQGYAATAAELDMLRAAINEGVIL